MAIYAFSPPYGYDIYYAFVHSLEIDANMLYAAMLTTRRFIFDEPHAALRRCRLALVFHCFRHFNEVDWRFACLHFLISLPHTPHMISFFFLCLPLLRILMNVAAIAIADG